MERIRIGVTGINAGDNPGPGIAVARSLKEATDLNVEIIGLAYDAMEPGIYLDWLVDRAFIVPYPSSGGETYIERLLEIQGRVGLDFVIPNLDAELPVYIHYAKRLEAHGIGLVTPTMRQFRLRGKDRLPAIAPAIGLEHPDSEILYSHDEIGPALERLQRPLMVKGVFYDAKRALNAAEVHAHTARIAAEWGFPVILQQMVSGEHLNLIGVGDGAGGLIGRLAIKKVALSSQGKIATGVTIDNPAMLAAAERFAATYHWRGPFELECILVGETLYLIEINPRFPAWAHFATGVGLNLPAALVRLGRNEPVDLPSTYASGKLFVRYCLDLVADMEPFQALVMKGETP